MSSTTLDAFWAGMVTTTGEIFQANWSLQYLILGSIIGVFCLIGLSVAFRWFFRGRRK